ncbi:hypothetical protein EXU48_06290 [Occultella glacieicola]|uniref:Lipoprotein n=1 Tax=Occultella glacieicola TaxID=2518684 RepID=A0ABY2E7Q9_9MICO|nr:hypothetical protein [Occultella glacieicola]TDE95866.1 hypothetical protein EXU48_06290 [Occultella glacieicola]
MKSAALALGLSLLVAGCGSPGDDVATSPPPSGGAAEPDGEGSSAPDAGTPSGQDTTGDGDATGEGCSAVGADARELPPDATPVPTVDLDGDGQADELWFSDADGRTLGVTTAAGGVFVTQFESGAPQAATAIGGRLGDGSAIVLLNTGRSVSLYAFRDCTLVPTRNDQGEQYTFDLGFTGYGTGVGCVDLGEGPALVGLNAVSDDDGATFEVTRTEILLEATGASASNGESEVVAEGATAQDPAVASAQSVSCGEPQEEAVEPGGA